MAVVEDEHGITRGLEALGEGAEARGSDAAEPVCHDDARVRPGACRPLEPGVAACPVGREVHVFPHERLPLFVVVSVG